jgi:DNA polymerase-1
VRGYWQEAEEAALVHAIYQLLTHPQVSVVGQNFLYDAQYFHRHWHYIPRVVRDTMIGQHSLWPNLPKALDFQSSMYCAHHVYWKDEGKEWDPRMGEDQFWTYNCKDAVATYEIDDVQLQLCKDMDLESPFNFQQSLFHPVLETMLRGVRVDQKKRGDFAMELSSESASRKQYLQSVLGHPINVKSSKQMQALFYDDLKQKVIRKKGTWNPTLDDEALTTIIQREPLLRPLVQKIQEIRSLDVFFSTFVSAPLDQDMRMRCSFNVAGTVTFRFTSRKNAFGSGTNLQNIPKGEESDDELALELPNVRKLFVPDPGMTFFDLDLSKADLRVVVWESDEQEMKAILRQGGDPYVIVAREYYRDPTIEKGSGIKGTKYDTFKRFCHGTHYLGKPPGLAKRLGLTVHEADRAQKWYFGKFPAIRKYLDDLEQQVLKRRMVQNVWGYKLHILDRVEGTLMNEVAAWKASSTVSVLINKAYSNIYRNIKPVQVLLQVHDSLAGQYPTDRGDLYKSAIISQATIQLPYSDPCVIPVGIKTSTESWGGCQ